MERLAADLAGEPVHFLVIYTREAHPGQFRFREIKQHRTFEDRCRLARRLREEARLENRTILVDRLDNSVTNLYRGFPNKLYLVGLDGKIRYASRWARAEPLRKELLPALEEVTAST